MFGFTRAGNECEYEPPDSVLSGEINWAVVAPAGSLHVTNFSPELCVWLTAAKKVTAYWGRGESGKGASRGCVSSSVVSLSDYSRHLRYSWLLPHSRSYCFAVFISSWRLLFLLQTSATPRGTSALLPKFNFRSIFPHPKSIARYVLKRRTSCAMLSPEITYTISLLQCILVLLPNTTTATLQDFIKNQKVQRNIQSIRIFLSSSNHRQDSKHLSRSR